MPFSQSWENCVFVKGRQSVAQMSRTWKIWCQIEVLHRWKFHKPYSINHFELTTSWISASTMMCVRCHWTLEPWCLLSSRKSSDESFPLRCTCLFILQKGVSTQPPRRSTLSIILAKLLSGKILANAVWMKHTPFHLGGKNGIRLKANGSLSTITHEQRRSLIHVRDSMRGEFDALPVRSCEYKVFVGL